MHVHTPLIDTLPAYGKQCAKLREAKADGEAQVLVAPDTNRQRPRGIIKRQGVEVVHPVLVLPHRAACQRHEHAVPEGCAYQREVALLAVLPDVSPVIAAEAERPQHGRAGLDSRHDEGCQRLQVRSDRTTLGHVHHLHRGVGCVACRQPLLAQGKELVERCEVLKVVVPVVEDTDKLVLCGAKVVQHLHHIAVLELQIAYLVRPVDALQSVVQGLVTDLCTLGEFLRQTVIKKLLIHAAFARRHVKLASHATVQQVAGLTYVGDEVANNGRTLDDITVLCVVGTVDHVERTFHEVAHTRQGREERRKAGGELPHETRGTGESRRDGTGL